MNAPLSPTPAAEPATLPPEDASEERIEQLSRPRRPMKASEGTVVSWRYVIAFVIVHGLALLACWPWLFSWTGVAWVLIGHHLFGMLGVTLCYHRILTHRGLELPKWLEYTFAVCGVCCLQDTPARWVAIHRIHHQYSDEDPDPHSPLITFLWGHMGWLIWENPYYLTADMYDRYAKDILRERFYRELERNFLWFWIYVGHALVIAGLGFLVGWAWDGTWMSGAQLGLSWLVWGVFVRTVFVWHGTFFVNSVTHVWGYQNYETSDNSQNNWLVALTTHGEGWHNNHHAHPRCAAHGHRWWEYDLTYLVILALERVGLATKVVHPKAEMVAPTDG